MKTKQILTLAILLTMIGHVAAVICLGPGIRGGILGMVSWTLFFLSIAAIAALIGRKKQMILISLLLPYTLLLALTMWYPRINPIVIINFIIAAAAILTGVITRHILLKIKPSIMKNKTILENKKTLIIILAIPLILSHLYMFTGYCYDYGGWRGTAGFAAVKPIDHTNADGTLQLVVMSAVESSVNISITEDHPLGASGVTNAGPIGAGDTMQVDITGITNFCGPGIDNYDVKLIINYTNLITGLSHGGNGRVWNKC